MTNAVLLPTASTFVIQFVSDHPSFSDAQACLPGVAGLDDCLLARVLPAGLGKSDRIQAFFPDRAGPLQDGERRVLSAFVR